MHKANPMASRLLCAANKESAVIRLTNYATPGAPSTITIIEALLATCVSSFVCAGSEKHQQFLVNASLVVNNPTQEAISEAYDYFGKISRMKCILSIGARPWALTSIPGKSDAYFAGITSQEGQAEQEAATQIEYRGLYFRFHLPRGPMGDAEPTAAWMGELEEATTHYLYEVQISNSMDLCVSKLQGRLGPQEGAICIPKLTGHFVMRDEPWSAMKRALTEKLEEMQEPRQRVMVLSGIGGSGKTQLARKFALNFRARCAPHQPVSRSSTLKKSPQI